MGFENFNLDEVAENAHKRSTRDGSAGDLYLDSVDGKIKVRKYNFGGNRAKIRETAVSSALILMRQCILEYYSEVAFDRK